MLAVAALGAAVALAADAAPTGWAPADAFWRAALVAALALAGSRARRWSWIAASAAVALLADGVWLGVGLAATAAAALSGLDRRPRRWLGAAVGATTGVVALHLPPSHDLQLTTVVVGAAALALVVSGYRASPARVRHWSRTVAVVAVGAWLLAAGVLVAVGLVARGAVDAGTAAAADGLEAAAGDPAEGPAARLGDAAAEFDRAAGWLGSWALAPARAMPVLGHQARAMADLSDRGARVSGAARDAVAAAPVDELRYEDGRVDLARLGAAGPAFDRLDAELAGAEAAAAEVRSPWLVAPLADRVELFDAHVREVAPPAHLAAVAVRELPELLGGSGLRRYLVLFTTPSESRGSGGFVGSWAVLEALDGDVTLAAQGRAADVNEAPGRDERTVTEPADYVARYGRFRPGYWFQDVTLSPDVPTSSRAAAEVFDQAGFGPVDGVVQVDPYGLAALLRLTGPVRVEGMDGPLRAEDAASFLLLDQYLEPLDRAEREDLLAEAGRATFDALLAADLPGPRRLGDVLGPVVADGRLSFTTWAPGTGELADLLHVERPFPRPDGADLAGLVTQNGGNNKADAFLHRSVAYDVSHDPASGHVEARATVVLRNDAPASGLPDAILGSNDRGLPPGTNRTWVSWYSPLGLREARLDGTVVPVERQQELGWSVYSTYVEIPPGGEARIELVLSGDVAPGDGYRLVVPHQPLVHPDEVVVTVRPVPGRRAELPPEGRFEDGAVRVAATGRVDGPIVVTMPPGGTG